MKIYKQVLVGRNHFSWRRWGCNKSNYDVEFFFNYEI